MAKKFSLPDLSRLGDDKALAIAAYGESVAAYRYIILSEKARDTRLRNSFEAMAAEERAHRDRIQKALQRLSPSAGFYLTNEDKLAVCVGPRLVDARDDARFDEAMRLVIASEKRTVSFYSRFAPHAADEEVRAAFLDLARAGIERVQKLRDLFRQAGKQVEEPCPVSQLKLG
jgi:rubrerythrin